MRRIRVAGNLPIAVIKIHLSRFEMPVRVRGFSPRTPGNFFRVAPIYDRRW